jgi:hypothetical protein
MTYNDVKRSVISFVWELSDMQLLCDSENLVTRPQSLHKIQPLRADGSHMTYGHVQ